MTMDLEGPAVTGPAANSSQPADAPADADAARLCDLAAQTSVGTLDALLAAAKQAAGEPGQYAAAAQAARRLSQRMTASQAQFRIAVATRG